MEKGYVYILTNPSFRDDWVKIGKSKRLPDVRSKELSNTAVPLPFEVYATLKTSKYHQAERLIHRSIDRISDLRINKSREFFKISPQIAYEIFIDIQELLGDEAELELHGDNIEIKLDTTSEKRKTSQIFNFYLKGIKDGDLVKFVGDDLVTAVVASSRQVFFEGQLWYLSPLAKELYERENMGNSSGSYQRPFHFTYNGKRLTEIPNIE